MVSLHCTVFPYKIMHLSSDSLVGISTQRLYEEIKWYSRNDEVEGGDDEAEDNDVMVQEDPGLGVAGRCRSDCTKASSR